MAKGRSRVKHGEKRNSTFLASVHRMENEAERFIVVSQWDRGSGMGLVISAYRLGLARPLSLPMSERVQAPLSSPLPVVVMEP